MSDLPGYYFRVRENGATVFRVDTENRQRRLELQPLAVVNVRNGEVRPQGGRELTEADTAAIRAWMAERAELLGQREMDEIRRTVDHLNLTAQWAQSRATEAQLDEITDALLLAMHDLRTVLVRKKSDRLPDAGERQAGRAGA